jgi:hypothetical protein
VRQPDAGVPDFRPALRFVLRLAGTCFGLICLAPAANAAPQQPPTLRWIGDPAETKALRVEVIGIDANSLHELRGVDWPPERWHQLLSIRVEQGDLFADVGLPPVQGKHAVTDYTLRFEAQFPLQAGVHYRAVFHPDKLPGAVTGAAPISIVCHLPVSTASPTTVVAHVYPSGDLLPENLLKFYIHFSAPMSRGNVYDHIRLREESGRYVDLPFLELGEELWDPSMKRLTLFIDPGRIKRGVQPLEELGPALEQGKSYVLEISRIWKDAAGIPLKADFRKTFKVGPPDRQPPDPALWRIHPPKSETRDPLLIAFPKPMDAALARRMIQVTLEKGQPLLGEVALEDEEKRWLFTPVSPWRRGAFQLLIQTTIEDLAGNNIGKPFEVDLVETTQRSLTNSTVNVSFEVR